MIGKLITHASDVAKGKTQLGKTRSDKWPGVRRDHLEKFPGCAVCGGKDKLEVHHIRPFHLHPELELDPTNLITLCEGMAFVNCHLFCGHLGSFRSFNVDVIKDSGVWNDKMVHRPTGDV